MLSAHLNYQYLRGLVEQHTNGYLDEFQSEMASVLHKEVSITTLWHALDRLNISNKNVSTSQLIVFFCQGTAGLGWVGLGVGTGRSEARSGKDGSGIEIGNLGGGAGPPGLCWIGNRSEE
jgi:hypothetical protein